MGLKKIFTNFFGETYPLYFNDHYITFRLWIVLVVFVVLVLDEGGLVGGGSLAGCRGGAHNRRLTLDL